MAIYKKLLKAEGKECNNIEVSLDYSLGGYNYWNGNTDGRGYYLYVTPMEVTEHTLSNGTKYNTVSQILGQGAKKLVKPVQRKGKKAEAEAITLAEQSEAEVVAYVCQKYGITLV